MALAIGVLATRHIWVAAVDGARLEGPAHIWPEPGTAEDALCSMPVEEIVTRIGAEVAGVARGREIAAVGVGFPGMIREGIIEESPNLQQVKGFFFQQALGNALAEQSLAVPVRVINDADALAAGIAATRDQLEKLVRVWYLGDGIGFGRYPHTDLPWEGGHAVVTLDPKERYCGCGGIGHLEGIMGHRAMRLRFLDREPEEIFAAARAGDTRCADFVKLWHRALAAASATSIHMEGPGRFFISGPNAEFLDTALLGVYLHEMVKMSPLQGSFFEVVSGSHELALIGAASSALRTG